MSETWEQSKERFWDKVEWEPNTGCALWTASVSRENSYGHFWLDGRLQRSNRVVWIMEHGPIPLDMWVLHRCDNPLCVNPAHLYLGDHARNVEDKMARGRQHRLFGEKNGRAKLTESQVLEIRRDYVHGSHTHGTTALGRRYGVDDKTIWRIMAGQRWTK